MSNLDKQNPHISSNSGLKVSWISNCFVTNETKLCIIDAIQRWIVSKDRVRHISSVNLTKLVMMQKDSRLAQSMLSSAVNLADGFPIYLATRLLRDPIPERITGIDMMMDLLRLADKNRYRVFFFGSKQDVLDMVIDKIHKDYPNIIIAGCRNGYYSGEDEKDVANSIGATRPDILFMALGLPQKEYFIVDHADRLYAPVVLPVGGAFDVFVGTKKRAPLWIQNIGGEWIWRSVLDKSKARHVMRNIGPFIKIIITAMIDKAKHGGKGSGARNPNGISKYDQEKQ